MTDIFFLARVAQAETLQKRILFEMQKQTKNDFYCLMCLQIFGGAQSKVVSSEPFTNSAFLVYLKNLSLYINILVSNSGRASSKQCLWLKTNTESLSNIFGNHIVTTNKCKCQ